MLLDLRNGWTRILWVSLFISFLLYLLNLHYATEVCFSSHECSTILDFWVRNLKYFAGVHVFLLTWVCLSLLCIAFLIHKECYKCSSLIYIADLVAYSQRPFEDRIGYDIITQTSASLYSQRKTIRRQTTPEMAGDPNRLFGLIFERLTTTMMMNKNYEHIAF